MDFHFVGRSTNNQYIAIDRRESLVALSFRYIQHAWFKLKEHRYSFHNLRMHGNQHQRSYTTYNDFCSHITTSACSHRLRFVVREISCDVSSFNKDSVEIVKRVGVSGG